MEGKIINYLDFNLCAPSYYRFLDRYCRVLNISFESK